MAKNIGEMQGDEVTYEIQHALDMLVEFTHIDISKMPLSDQISICGTWLKMGELAEPFVKQYGRTEEEKEKETRTTMQKILSALFYEAQKDSETPDKD